MVRRECRSLQKKYLRSQYFSVSDYIGQSRMRYSHSWATEVKIQVAGDFLGINVYIFLNGHWRKYNILHSIYLENVGNHYENVVCASQPGQHCLDFCKVREINGDRARLRSKRYCTGF